MTITTRKSVVRWSTRVAAASIGGLLCSRAATSNSSTCGRVKLLHPGAVGRVEL
jgi:hypothetical protein